ncbi:MAG: diguanylate cyclase [Labilithrix sp.]|nr:diguanylate cyclase [Labilithrix sp.]
MARILLVDDSASARALLGARLREKGHTVDEAAHAADAAEMALGSPPDAVVTDLFMPGISGLQLCRLLRAEPATAHVPVVLLTASDDRRSRFWARNAGATAYVTKTEIDRLTQVLGDLTSSPMTRPPPTQNPQVVTRGNVQERLSQLLDASLFESTIAGEVRALSQKAEELEQLFADLAALASDVAGYRWLALATDAVAAPHVVHKTRLFIHTHPDLRDAAEREARDALEVPPPPERRKPAEGDAHVITDKRAVEAEWSTPPILLPIRFGTTSIGQVAIAPSRRGASHDDRRLIAILASELGGPLRMAALVAEARRLASTDTLTGLLNRRAFVERIDKARAASDKQLFPISVLLLDVDHFKKVNDTLGHDAGDAVLQGVARTLTSIARKSDFVARWGGEEFVLALTMTAEAGARVAAERVRRAIADSKYVLPSGAEHRATASVGLASAEGPDWQLDDLLGRADKAMYSAKHRGRNRVETA